jgi:hypothetical protein
MPKNRPIPEQRFRELWHAGVSLRGIADELGISQDHASATRRRLGLPPRYGSFAAASRAKAEPIIDPTPDEILERTAAIQSRWDDRTRESRRVTKTAGPYQFPEYRTEDVFQDGETQTNDQ